jgi:DNA-binding NarL/FixJ family response regulator
MAPTVAAATKLSAEITGLEIGIAALTPREREIAAFLAAGMLNREIADQLVLSERTIETHVHNLLPKTWAQKSHPGRRLGAAVRARW